jgi:hypothetical protein
MAALVCTDVTIPPSLIALWIGVLLVPVLLLLLQPLADAIYRHGGVRTLHILMIFSGVLNILITLRLIDALPCF